MRRLAVHEPSVCARGADGISVGDSTPRSVPNEFALEGEERGRCYSLASASTDVVSMEHARPYENMGFAAH
jgi:hypothetical protein